MERLDLDALRRRSRRTYEIGRWRRASVSVLPAAALALLATRAAGEIMDPIVTATILALVSVAFSWWGQHAGSAVLPGTLAGTLPFAAALAVRWSGETRFATCAVVSFVASAIGGLLLARRVRRSDARARAWLYAGAIALLTGSVACSCIGLGGFVGLVLGLAAVATPSLLLLSRSDSVQ